MFDLGKSVYGADVLRLPGEKLIAATQVKLDLGERNGETPQALSPWTPGLTARALRSHQEQLAAVVAAIATGQTEARDILAAVTPGGGKSLLPVIAAVALKRADLIDRVCWVVPRDSLRLQAEEAFADPRWRTALGHSLTVRAAENAPDPSRGLDGYVTTYQGVAAAPDLHLAEFRRHRTLLVIDEMHHLPALADVDPHTAAHTEDPEDAQASRWSKAILPMLGRFQPALTRVSRTISGRELIGAQT